MTRHHSSELRELQYVLGSVILLLTVGCAHSPGRDTADARIREEGVRHAESWRRNDAAAVSSSFAENGVLAFPDAPDVRGREGVRGALATLFASTHIDSLQVMPGTIEVCDSVAHEWGTYREVYRPQGQAAVREDGRYVVRWIRQPSGEWRISRFTGNTIRRS